MIIIQRDVGLGESTERAEKGIKLLKRNLFKKSKQEVQSWRQWTRDGSLTLFLPPSNKTILCPSLCYPCVTAEAGETPNYTGFVLVLALEFCFLTLQSNIHTLTNIKVSAHKIYGLCILLSCLKKENPSNPNTNMLSCATVDPSVYFIQQVLYIRRFQTVSSLCLIIRSGDAGSLTSRWRPIS